MTTIVIGDIHGCSREFSALLDKVAPSAGTQLVLLGDLLNKGPDPVGVVEIFESLDCVCLLGNNDRDHLRWQAGGVPKEDSLATRKSMPGEVYGRYLEHVAKMPLFFENEDLVAVHAAVLSGVDMADQPVDVLTGDVNLERTWKDGITLDRPLVAGHKRYNPDQCDPYIVEGKFYGIDTGCVYGGCLTALWMPSGKVAQVRAARDYSAGERS